jgi:hypothetical protein
MSSLRHHVPLALITVVLSVAIYILHKELRAVKSQAAIGAQFAATFQQKQMFPPQFLMEPMMPPPEQQQQQSGDEDQGHGDDEDDQLPAPVAKPSKVQKRQ